MRGGSGRIGNWNNGGGCDPVVFEMAGCLFRVGGGSPEFAGASEGGVWCAVAGVVADVFVAKIGGESGFFAGATPANWMIGAST